MPSAYSSGYPFIPFAMKDYLVNLSFIYRLRWLFLLPFTLVGNTFYLLAAAPDYKNESLIIQKKEEVIRLYERKRYAQANEQIELFLPLLKNRIERSKFELYQAYCSFHEKKYLVSAHQFHLFIKQYPSFPQVEEALFMCGYSLACENVDIRLDQTNTYDAMRSLERYLALYPKGAYLDKASDALQNLQERLMQKSFQAAALYVRLGYYNAAIVPLKNFDQAYPDASLKEKVLRLLLKCYEKLAASAFNEGRKKEVIARYQLEEYLNSKGRSNVVKKLDRDRRDKKIKQ
ncbi:outer membrane protein assembly factor BamD [Cardinium endosymbiont of Oedothorax gibbosus]|uniref:outer membrane protein assembly factor BamD n=1 Tax=Cardinium endosymbiont of Oedothorax gibbosus TaxID=931101 RepID=UPI002024041A|nr:outer membrane protein assembly factor BamD [Cardinium endosymbiont of Oedothorax gibbosus]CAH2560104.1 Putative Outer membrane protein assembly factor BamD [Cardinium endosymbiont of Oedothorax gibbosus]